MRWIDEKRFDILREVVLNPKFILDPGRYGNTPQWMIDTGHILFGDEEQRCPFLRESSGGEPAGCSIHDIRPRVCERFPFDMDGRIRADVLDLCAASIFYHSTAAEEEQKDFIEYVEEISSAPIRAKARLGRLERVDISSAYVDSDLRVSLTSELGVSMAEEAFKRTEGL